MSENLFQSPEADDGHGDKPEAKRLTPKQFAVGCALSYFFAPLLIALMMVVIAVMVYLVRYVSTEILS